jgi:hypothetical protein
LVDKGITNKDVILDSLKISKTLINRFLITQIIIGNGTSLKELKEYYSHKITWIIFALMPLFALILYLIYIRRKIYFVDHLIFAFHLHTAVFLMIAIVSLLEGLSHFKELSMAYFYVPFYYFAALKNVYKQSLRKTIFKGFLIGILYLILGLLAFILIFSLLYIFY